MILVRDYFQSFTDRPIGDPAGTVSAATAIFLDDREAVDATLADGIAGGASRRWLASGGHQPSSRRRPSAMPKWCATSWITVWRTWRATSCSVWQIAAIAWR